MIINFFKAALLFQRKSKDADYSALIWLPPFMKNLNSLVVKQFIHVHALGIDHQQTILRLVHKCITPIYRGISFSYNLWPKFAKLLATWLITIHEFH